MYVHIPFNNIISIAWFCCSNTPVLTVKCLQKVAEEQVGGNKGSPDYMDPARADRLEPSPMDECCYSPMILY